MTEKAGATRWLAVFGILLLMAWFSGQGEAAESARPSVEGRARLRGIKEGNAIRVFRGSPLSISVDLVPVLGTKVRQAQKWLENERKQLRAAGRTEAQIEQYFSSDHYARRMKGIVDQGASHFT